jgi:UDP-N-acetylglucosamine 2-epimerase (non-hydrolysing)
MPPRIAVVVGTRPEAIKMAPVIQALRNRPGEFECVVVSTAQHREMLDQVLTLFSIVPDIDLDIMRPDQHLSSLTALAINLLTTALGETRPDLLLVQGDTTTAFAAALAALYVKVPVGHVEAGLRSHDLRNPFPEEANRCLISTIADLHFAPTERARRALLNESVPAARVMVTGNTVVDSFEVLVKQVSTSGVTPLPQLSLDGSRVLLVTSHRRESWGGELESICLALKDIAAAFPDVQVVYPVHLNPNVQRTVRRVLQGAERIHMVPPLDYFTFLSVMQRSYLILTDSGGVQEEAPSLQIPLLVLRTLTERPEACEAGVAKIVGTDRATIVKEASRLLSDNGAYRAMAQAGNPFGDGHASARIATAVSRWVQGMVPMLDADEQFHAPEVTR